MTCPHQKSPRLIFVIYTLHASIFPPRRYVPSTRLLPPIALNAPDQRPASCPAQYRPPSSRMAYSDPHASSSPVARRYELNCWMDAIPDVTRLADINIPGTHDSGAIAKSLSRCFFFHLYSRQSRSISLQLANGVRILDVRIQISRTRKGGADSAAVFDFHICHGGVLSAVNLNRYQSLDSLLQECNDFLSANASECLVISFKVDNWKGFEEPSKEDASSAKADGMRALRHLFNKYRHLYSDFPKRPADEPAAVHVGKVELGDVRGKIVFFSRIPDLNDEADDRGVIPVVPFDNPGNPEGLLLPGTSIYLQDRYEGLERPSPTRAKLGLITRGFDYKKSNTESVVWSFASATRDKLLLVNVHYALLNEFGKLPVSERRVDFGWLLFDFAVSKKFFYSVNKKVKYPIDVVSFIIDSNFQFSRYPDAFKAISIFQ